MALLVENLTLDRGGRRIVSDLSFAVEDGTALILRGPNGAGKSTLIRALAGLGQPSAGRIVLLQAQKPVDIADQLAYAGHLDAVKPAMSVAENLRFWARFLGSAEVGAALDVAMETFALGPIAQQPAAMCSAGQRRRLGLARLLLAPRRLWLLDEPSVSLDVATVATLCGLIDRHCETGGIALVATHTDLAVARKETLELRPPERPAPGTGQNGLVPASGGAMDPFLAENIG
ncbi:MAG: heme ABC exporter ATP-binding protein CcmA [Pseudomonadota bacterium]